MPDWKNPLDYEFAAQLDRTGWTWEFMRRNKQYCDDYAEAQKLKSGSVLHKTSDPEYIPAAVRLARRWRVVPPIRDPNGHETPKFDLRYPVEPSFESIADYYDDEDSSKARSEFAILVFDLTAPLETQLRKAKTGLVKSQKGKQFKKPLKFHKKNWTNYLRLLDAEIDGATPAQLQKFIEAYKPISSDADHKHQVSDKIWDHRKAAESLRDHPRSILFLSP